jgi:hypothetical protein
VLLFADFIVEWKEVIRSWILMLALLTAYAISACGGGGGEGGQPASVAPVNVCNAGLGRELVINNKWGIWKCNLGSYSDGIRY